MLQFILFFCAWICAQLVLDILKAFLIRRNQQRMIEDIYLKVSKITISLIKDMREVKRSV